MMRRIATFLRALLRQFHRPPRQPDPDMERVRREQRAIVIRLRALEVEADWRGEGREGQGR